MPLDLLNQSNDDLLGKIDLSKQSNDDLLGPEPSAVVSTLRAIPYFLGNGGVTGAVARDQFFQGTAAGRILDAFGVGASNNWGSEPVGLDKDTEKWARSVGLITSQEDSPWHQPFRAFNEGILRQGSTLLDAAMRAPGALIGGIAGAAGQGAVELGASPTTGAQIEADINLLPFALGDVGLVPPAARGEAEIPPVVKEARDLGIIGTERETAPLTLAPIEEKAEVLKGEEIPAQQVAAADAKETAKEPLGSAQAKAPTIDELARQADPATMDQWQSLQARRDTYRQWLDELGAQRLAQATANSPYAEQLSGLNTEIAGLQDRIPDATPRLAKKYQARITDLQSQVDDLQQKQEQYVTEATAGDSPDMAKVRQALMRTDFRMRDLSPAVTRAYRQAQEAMGGEEPAQAPLAAAEQNAAPEPPQAPEKAPEEPVAAPEASPIENATPAEPQTVPVAQEAIHPTGGAPNVVGEEKTGGGFRIADDVAAKLIKAGRPEDEAKAAAAIIQARYETRAARFGGSRGTAEELYRAEAPEIRKGGKTKPAVLELAQNDLPMDEASRMARAKAMGFRVGMPVYHGTGADFDTFKAVPTSREGLQTPGVSVALDPDVAEEFALRDSGQTNPQIYPLLHRAMKPAVLTLDGTETHAEVVGALRDAFDEGFDAVMVRNYTTPGGKTGKNIIIVRDANQLRSRAARFNPDEAESADLLAQAKNGTIRFVAGSRPVIRLMASADASTFMHETGHAWLEELMRDAKTEGVHESVIKDAQTIRNWLGNDGGEITRAQHEKFARAFEQYLYTGRAPSASLAGVFRQFRNWLTRIYQNVKRLGAPISDDIRDVFDRLIVENPDRQTPPEPFGKSLADLHEIDAEHSPGEIAREIGHNVRGEIALSAQERPPLGEDIPDTGIGSRDGRRPANPEELAGAGEEAGNHGRGGEGNAPASPALGGGAGETEAEGAGPREGEGAAEGERGGEGETLTLPKAQPVRDAPTEPSQRFNPAPKPERYFDKAGNIRLENLNRPEDIKDVLRISANENAGFIEARGGVKTLVEQQQAADALGLDPKSFIPNRPEGISESTWLRAVKDLTLQSATQVRDLMVKARNSGSDEDAAAFGKALARHHMIQQEFSRAKAESGRALAANRWDDAKAEVEGVGRMAEQATGMTLYQLKSMARDGAVLENPAQVSRFIDQALKPRLRDKIQYVALNGLISGLVTHSTYFVTNALVAIEESLLERPLAAAMGTARELIKGEPAEGRVYWSEVGAGLYGALKGAQDGVRAAAKAWRENAVTPLPHEDLIRPNSVHSRPNPFESELGKKIGTVIGYPGRMVGALDSFNRSVFYSMNIQARAVRAADDLGLAGEVRARKIADLVANPTEDMIKDAVDYATSMAYMKKPEYGSFMYHVERAANRNILAKLTLPFARASANIIEKAYVERTPVGLLSTKIRDDLLGRNGAAAADMARARMTAGIVIGGALTSLAALGLATGSGPAEPGDRRAWLINHQPYSVKVGDTWVSYKRLGHLGMIMGLGADLAESIHAIAEQDAEKAAVQIAHAIGENVVNESWMTSVAHLLDIIDNPQEAKGALYGFGEELIPFSSFLRQTANAMDEYKRRTNSFGESVQNMIPIWRNGLFPKRDVWGNPMLSNEAPLSALAASPFQSRIPNDTTIEELRRIGVYPSYAPKKISGVELSEKQYDDYQRVSGRLMKSALDRLVSSPGWGGTPEGIKAKIAHTVMDKMRANARAAILMQYPDILEKAIAAKKQALH